MISVISLYQDTARDDSNEAENGSFSYGYFNRNLKRAQINLLKFLTGDLVPTKDFPMPFETQKNKDYLKDFITPFKANNWFELPKDFFAWDNLSKIGQKVSSDCNDKKVNCNTQIEILDGQKFYNRCNSYIDKLNPNRGGKPIAKIVANRVEFMPIDIGSVLLEYIRYPKEAFIKTKLDPEFNEEVPDEATSQNLEWGEWAREPLIWFMVNKFGTHTSNKTLKENNYADKPRG